MATNSHRFLKANLLSFFLLGGVFVVGFVAGTWLPPILVLLFGDHELSLGDFPLKAGIIPLVPKAISPKADRLQYVLLEYGNAFVGIACAALLGRYGLRYNHYLIVKKFGWLTQEEAMSTEKFQWL
jgi:hypothetical protein